MIENTHFKLSDEIESIAGFSIRDFATRWGKARLQACAMTLVEVHANNPDLVTPNEYELLALCSPEKKDELLKNVFDLSRALASSASRYYKVAFEIQDLAKVLSLSGSPCVGGQWSTYKEAYIYSRKGCAQFSKIGSLVCDYWREACDGLVMGLGEDERFTRHSSIGHGDPECLDVIFVDKPTRSKSNEHGSEMKWLPLPEFLKKDLDAVVERMNRLRVKVEFLGYAEGKVYYLLENKEDPTSALCGPGGRYFHEKLKEEVNKTQPELIIQDAAPLAVYGEKA
jgi:hypothetical protein